jgi:hypothetical protein
MIIYAVIKRRYVGVWAEAHIRLPNEVTWSGMSCFPSPLNFCFNVLHINFFVTYC